MGRKLLVGFFALTLTACGDPLVIIGDLPGFMRVVAGVPDSIGMRLDSSALRSKLTHPAGLAISNAGVLYFADQSTRVFSVTSAGKLKVLYSSIACFEKTCLGRAEGVAISSDGNVLYIADNMSDKIWRLTISNGELVAIAGTGVNGVAPDGTVALQAPLASPTGIAVLPDNRVIFAERNSHKIRVIGADGVLRTFAGTGTAGQAVDGAPATTSPLNTPTGLAVANNTAYVTETGTNTVRAIDIAAGTIRLIAGNGNAGFSGDGGSATQAALNTPWAVAASADNVFIADQGNDRVRVVNMQTNTIATFAGTGSKLYNGNGRAAGETSLYLPWAVAVSPFGFLYISDYGHNVVWRTPVGLTLR